MGPSAPGIPSATTDPSGWPAYGKGGRVESVSRDGVDDLGNASLPLYQSRAMYT